MFKDRVHEKFEEHVNWLISLPKDSELPQWTDADVIGAHIILTRLKNLSDKKAIDELIEEMGDDGSEDLLDTIRVRGL